MKVGGLEGQSELLSQVGLIRGGYFDLFEEDHVAGLVLAELVAVLLHCIVGEVHEQVLLVEVELVRGEAH